MITILLFLAAPVVAIFLTIIIAPLLEVGKNCAGTAASTALGLMLVFNFTALIWLAIAWYTWGFVAAIIFGVIWIVYCAPWMMAVTAYDEVRLRTKKKTERNEPWKKDR